MKNLSKTEKENIVKRCLSGEGITVLANEYGISGGSIYNWINEFKMQKKVKVNIGEFRKLSQKCEKLEKIIKLLQESPFIEKIYSESDHIYGAGKIAAILNNSGHKVSDRLLHA